MGENAKSVSFTRDISIILSAAAIMMCGWTMVTSPAVVEAGSIEIMPEPAPTRPMAPLDWEVLVKHDELARQVTELRNNCELLVEAGVVKSGGTVPLPNGGKWRDGTPIEPTQWVISASCHNIQHTWRGTPKGTHCTIDQDTRVVKVYSEKWTYPGEGTDRQGSASYLIVCSRQLNRSIAAAAPGTFEKF